MKGFLISCVTVLILSQACFSQEKKDSGSRILFKGLVMDASTMVPVANTQIMINSIFSAVSGNDGSFSFYINRFDTVLFRRLGYKSTVLNISDTLSGREFIAGIYMNSDTLSIGEIVIIPKFINLKSEIMNSRIKVPEGMENARYNVAVSAYQARNSQNSLGDPSANYEQLHHKQKIDAFEKGGIPSDKILGVSPLLLVPAAYLLIKGFPESPAPMNQQLTEQEVDQLHKKYIESRKQRK